MAWHAGADLLTAAAKNRLGSDAPPERNPGFPIARRAGARGDILRCRDSEGITFRGTAIARHGHAGRETACVVD